VYKLNYRLQQFEVDKFRVDVVAFNSMDGHRL